jgi:hypothetical protein
MIDSPLVKPYVSQRVPDEALPTLDHQFKADARPLLDGSELQIQQIQRFANRQLFWDFF